VTDFAVELENHIDAEIDAACRRPARIFETELGPVEWRVPEYPTWLPGPPTAVERWFHGGPAVAGRAILPASMTGNPRPAHVASIGEPLWPSPFDPLELVHITNDPALAAGYAGYDPDDAWLYEVVPVSWLDLDPRYPPSGVQRFAGRTPAAQIIARHRLTPSVARLAHTLAEAHYRTVLDGWEPTARVDPWRRGVGVDQALEGLAG
jgi:hypothetical protein